MANLQDTVSTEQDSTSVLIGDMNMEEKKLNTVEEEIVETIAGLTTEAGGENNWDDTIVPAARAKEFESFVIPINDDKIDANRRGPVNTYAARKTVAQGMMDIALITANANQLRYIIEFNSQSRTYYLSLVLIVMSLMLQVGVGVSLIFKGRLDLRGQSKCERARRINNYVVVAVFLVTIINVFIASFTITGSGTAVVKTDLVGNGNQQ